MPAQRLGEQPSQVSKYDIVAQDSKDVPEFICHTGLADEDRDDVTRISGLRVAHMKPPLTPDDETHPLQAVGTASLSAAESRKVGIFVDEHLSEYKAQKVRRFFQYTILPHVLEPDADCPCRRFSCVGFVIEAYDYADIDLVVTDPKALPPVSLKTLCDAYPDVALWLQEPCKRQQFGLNDDEDWPVVLAGYVMNSLERSVDDIRREPYTPAAGDEFFPRRVGGRASTP